MVYVCGVEMLIVGCYLFVGNIFVFVFVFGFEFG